MNQDQWGACEFLWQGNPKQLLKIPKSLLPPSWQKERQKQIELKKKENKEYESSILEKVHYCYSKEFYQECKKYLIELHKAFPNNTEYHKLKEQTDKKINSLVLEAAIKKYKSHKPLQKTASKKDLHYVEKLKGQKTMPYDVALAFLSMGFYAEAAEMLKTSQEEYQLWLRVHALIEARLFVEALDTASQIKPTESEGIYALSYLKALIYKGLGQDQMALSILKNIADNRPNYRHTQLLLEDWKKQ